jgi:hypothetical protein
MAGDAHLTVMQTKSVRHRASVVNYEERNDDQTRI